MLDHSPRECHKLRNARSSSHYLFYWDVSDSNTLTRYSRSTLTSSLLSVSRWLLSVTNESRIRLVNGPAVIELLNLNARHSYLAAGYSYVREFLQGIRCFIRSQNW